MPSFTPPAPLPTPLILIVLAGVFQTLFSCSLNHFIQVNTLQVSKAAIHFHYHINGSTLNVLIACKTWILKMKNYGMRNASVWWLLKSDESLVFCTTDHKNAREASQSMKVLRQIPLPFMHKTSKYQPYVEHFQQNCEVRSKHRWTHQ